MSKVSVLPRLSQPWLLYSCQMSYAEEGAWRKCQEALLKRRHGGAHSKMLPDSAHDVLLTMLIMTYNANGPGSWMNVRSSAA